MNHIYREPNWSAQLQNLPLIALPNYKTNPWLHCPTTKPTLDCTVQLQNLPLIALSNYKTYPWLHCPTTKPTLTDKNLCYKLTEQHAFPDKPEFLGLTDSHEIESGSMTQFSKVHGHWNQYLTTEFFIVAYCSGG